MKVIFRKFKTGEIIALFPTEAGDCDSWTCGSYMHVGQHGSAGVFLFHDTVPAAPAEYAGLLAELKRIGYTDLEITKQFTKADHEARAAQLRRI